MSYFVFRNAHSFIKGLRDIGLSGYMDPDTASEVAARLHEEFGPVASAVEEEIKASGRERKETVCGSGLGVQGWSFL